MTTPAPSLPIPPHWKVAIDGPAASGKTTVARGVARALGYCIIDTGAMYRAVALAALRQGMPTDDGERLSSLARDEAAHYRFVADATTAEGYRLLVRGEDITEQLHAPQVSGSVAAIAAVPGVRRVLAGEQRRLGLEGGVVMTGRDIGTVVLPEAEIKIFLTASAEERTRRRVQDLSVRGDAADPKAVFESLRQRDHTDSARADSPLVAADDAVTVDTTAMTLDEVIAHVVGMVQGRWATRTGGPTGELS